MTTYSNEYIKRKESEGYTFITPDVASKFLKQNKNNRHVRVRFIKQLVSKIQNGEWQEDIPDHIAFYEDGTLANGQHRLLAISQSEVQGVFSKIDYDVPLSAAICIDTGKSRSAGDNIKILTGETFYTPKITKMITISAVHGKALTHEDHLHIALAYKPMIVFVKDLFNNSPRWMQQTSVMAAIYLYLINDKATTDTMRNFVEVLRSGRANTEGEETVLRFREVLQSEYFTKSSTHRNYTDEIKRAENVIDHYIQGSKLKVIRVPDKYKVPLYNYNIKEGGDE